MMKSIRLLAALATILLGGCAQIPVAELSVYSESYEKARIAGNLLLSEVAPFVPREAGKAADKNCDVDPVKGFRPCFTVALALGDRAAEESDPVDIRVRRAALGSVSTYNQLLADLAGGRSAEALAFRIDELTALVSSAAAIVPGGGALGVSFAAAPFKSLLTKLETMRASNAAASSVLEAEGDVRAMIRMLRDDAPALYEVYVAQFIGERGDIKIELAEAKIDENQAEIDRLTAKLAALSDPAGASNRARRFEAALVGYVRMLDQSERALAALAEAIRAPTLDPIASVSGFVRQATEARVVADAFLLDVRALRSAP